MDKQRVAHLKLSEKGIYLSILTYVLLTILKLYFGIMTESNALRADGLNSASDVIALVALLIGIKISQRPADEDHPYGHWKAETLSSFLASIIMVFIGIQVVYSSLFKLFQDNHQAPNILSVWIAIISAVTMFFVYQYNKYLAKKTKSQAIWVASKDNLADAWISSGTAIGIIFTQIGLPWLDPMIAIGIGILIIKTAWGIFQDTSHHLTDGFDQSNIESYHHIILSIDGVYGVKDIRGRNYGHFAILDIVLLVNPKLMIEDAHDISTKVENELKKNFPLYAVHVHIEPSL